MKNLHQTNFVKLVNCILFMLRLHLTVLTFDNQERNLSFAITDFQVLKLKCLQ